MSDSGWRALYLDAVTETDFDKLVERIGVPEKTIPTRLRPDGLDVRCIAIARC